MQFMPCRRFLSQLSLRVFPHRTWSQTPWHSKSICNSASSGQFSFFHSGWYKHCTNGIFNSWQNHDRKSIHTTSLQLDKNFKPTPPEEDPSLEWTRNGKEYLKGPDQVIPSTAIYTWRPNGAVRVSKLGREPGVSRPPISIPSLFRSRAEAAPNIPAMAVKRNNVWEKWTYENYYDDSRKAAKGFIALGLQPFHSVCILGFNSPEWLVANMGAIMAGGIAAGIYTTNSGSSCKHIGEDSKANIYVVENEQQLSKILQHRSALKDLKGIVQYIGRPGADGVLSWNQLLELGASQSDDELNKRLQRMGVNQCSTLIYTSGTTGKPKGVMLSHDNLTWLAYEAATFSGLSEMGSVHELVSYLPLSHIAAQHVDIYQPLCMDGTIFFADSNALKGSLIDTLREIQPTVFMGVPRVYEKFYEKLMEIGSKNKGVTLKIANWAKHQATLHNEEKLAGGKGTESTQFKMAEKILLARIRHAMGLSRQQTCITSAAPISVEMLKYFLSLNLVVGEAYGLSECSGPHTTNCPLRQIVRLGSIGMPIPGVSTKLDQTTADGQGEVCLGGRHVLMGYLNLEKTTKTAVDKEGWLHTEDMGRIDKDGFMYITGRIKELIITAGGENVAPVPIEEAIKQALPCLSNVMVIGDKLKFLSCLVTLKSEMNPDTNEPLQKLTAGCKRWVEQYGACKVDTVKDVLKEVYEKKNSKLIHAFDAGLAKANIRCVSRACRVRKWVILPKDFSMPGGELGPTLKLKRSVALQKYQDVVQEIYKHDLEPDSTHALG